MRLHLPWLEMCVGLPLIGAVCVGLLRRRDRAQVWSLIFSSLAFICCAGAWLDFSFLRAAAASDPGGPLERVTGRPWLSIDELSAPLLPLTGLLYLLTALVTLRTQARRFSFGWTLTAQAIILAILSCREPRGLVALLAASTVPPYLELRRRHQPTRVFTLHMALFISLLVIGWLLLEAQGAALVSSSWTLLPLFVAVLIRSGIVPLHCWMTDLFEHATFGRALLFVSPMTGAYACIRLVLPAAPTWMLHAMGLAALITAVYSGGMALVQREARRFFCYIFLSHSALVLVGLATASPIGLAGALSLWFSVGLSLAGFGLTLRALEARHGRLSLATYHGLYENKPLLAVCFLLTGMASVGFPGTIGFLGAELLVDGAVEAYPHIGVMVALATALNGIAVVKAYFALFAGQRKNVSVPLHVGWREKIAVLTLSTLIIGGGLYPQPGVASRYRAAESILMQRMAETGSTSRARAVGAAAIRR
jgi:NADH-quinone oxidoreductase subunit M